MRKIERELQQAFPFVRLEVTNGGHIRLRLPNGKSVIVGSTPGSRFFLLQARADVRRQMTRPSRGLP